jgi:NADH-quinone oxidoreductase subunit M
MNEMGGLWQQMPRMGAVALFFALASLGLPGLGNFVAEFLILLGLFKVNVWMAAAAALGLITAAVYSLIMMQKSFYGKPNDELTLDDFGSLEMTAMAVMIIALVWLGLYPQPVLDMVQPVVDSLLASQQNLISDNATLSGTASGLLNSNGAVQ